MSCILARTLPQAVEDWTWVQAKLPGLHDLSYSWNWYIGYYLLGSLRYKRCKMVILYQICHGWIFDCHSWRIWQIIRYLSVPSEVSIILLKNKTLNCHVSYDRMVSLKALQRRGKILRLLMLHAGGKRRPFSVQLASALLWDIETSCPFLYRKLGDPKGRKRDTEEKIAWVVKWFLLFKAL